MKRLLLFFSFLCLDCLPDNFVIHAQLSTYETAIRDRFTYLIHRCTALVFANIEHRLLEPTQLSILRTVSEG